MYVRERGGGGGGRKGRGEREGKERERVALSLGPFPAFQCCKIFSVQRCKAGNGPGDEARREREEGGDSETEKESRWTC